MEVVGIAVKPIKARQHTCPQVTSLLVHLPRSTVPSNSTTQIRRWCVVKGMGSTNSTGLSVHLSPRSIIPFAVVPGIRANVLHNVPGGFALPYYEQCYQSERFNVSGTLMHTLQGPAAIASPCIIVLVAASVIWIEYFVPTQRHFNEYSVDSPLKKSTVICISKAYKYFKVPMQVFLPRNGV